MVDSDLKVGSSNAEGVYVKDTQLLQFDWSKLQSNLSYVFDSVVRTDFPLMIANLSSHQIYLYRDNQLTVVEPGKIDWYTVGYNNNPVSLTIITKLVLKNNFNRWTVGQLETQRELPAGLVDF